MSFSISEQSMWDKPTREPRERIPDVEIDEKYASQEERIVTESNREKLPNFVEALSRPGYMKVRPVYQRRPRWDAARQSRLIESFIINIPVPPLFLYETTYNTYEVMDGQQRIKAIQQFYSNELKLTGLDRWPELNGKTYSKLPPKIKAGIDRRSISYVVVLTESAANEEDQMLLKQLVFERLNTGGVKLSHQEIRNSLYQGTFNNLLIDLSRNSSFRKAWQIPEYSLLEEEIPSKELERNAMYTEMDDVEVVLRFFALRHASQYTRGMKGFLDLYMARSRRFTDLDLQYLRDLFTSTMDLTWAVFGAATFRPYSVKEEQWAGQPQKAFADAVMVGMSRFVDRAAEMLNHRDEIVEATKKLFSDYPQGTFTGRGNTKEDVNNRIDLFAEMLESNLAGEVVP